MRNSLHHSPRRARTVRRSAAAAAATALVAAAVWALPTAQAVPEDVDGTMVLSPVAGPTWSRATSTILRFRGFQLAGTADLGSLGTWQVATDEQATLRLPDFATGSVQGRITMTSDDATCDGTFHVTVDLVDGGSGRLDAVCDDGTRIAGTYRDVETVFDGGHLVQVTRAFSGTAVTADG